VRSDETPITTQRRVILCYLTDMSRRVRSDETPITTQRRVILCYRPMKIAIKRLWKR